MSEWVSTDRLGQGGGQTEPPPDSEWEEELWDKVEGVRHLLTRIINPAKLTPFLRQCKVIDEQDEDEVLNSTQYPLRISKAGRLLDILRGRGQRGLQAFMESLEFYHPEQYTQLTGRKPTQRCSLLLDEEGPEGLTQFLLLEVRKLREQLRETRLGERRLSQRCRVAEEERSRAERRAQELRQECQQLARLRQNWESRIREQAVNSRALEEQRQASVRERQLLGQIEQLKNRLMEAERQAVGRLTLVAPISKDSEVPCRPVITPVIKEVQCHNPPPGGSTQALLDILQQDRLEAAEQRQELCLTISRLQQDLSSAETHTEKLASQCEQLQLKVQVLQQDWEMEQKRSVSYFNQVLELEKERDQALRSRDSLQLEYTDCLLDKDRQRKKITELQARLDHLQREREREEEESRDQRTSCLHCSHLSLFSEDQCFGPCCSLKPYLSDISMCLSPHSDSGPQPPCKTLSHDHNSETSGGSCLNSQENLYTPLEENERDVNRLSIFPFPPGVNSINRRINTEFELDSWCSDENLSVLTPIAGGQRELSLSDSCSSLNSHLFPPDLISLPPVPPNKPLLDTFRSEPPPPSASPVTRRRCSLADDITVIGGNLTGIFVRSVRAGSPAELCGLREGTELLELERVLFGGESLQLRKCTSEVAHFSLQWWTEPSSLKHQLNIEAYSQLCLQISSPSFRGADSFYVRVNLDIDSNGDPSCLGLRCDDILHVTDTLCGGKYQWCCARVERDTAKHLQSGSIPNYNRAQQLFLVKLRTISLEQKDSKKMFSKKCSERVRLVKAVSSSCRGNGDPQQFLYTFSHRQEDNLIPYSMVQPIWVKSRRPVIFSPSLLSRGLIERLLQPVESGLEFNTCHPEPITDVDRRDKRVFLLDPPTREQAHGIRLESIQDVMSQGRHCLLQLGLSSVEGLLRQGVYPIVIHINPKDKKGKKLKKFFSGRGEDQLMEEVCKREELQLESLPMLYHTIGAWSCTEDLLLAIRHAIHSQQGAVVWVEPDRLQ